MTKGKVIILSSGGFDSNLLIAEMLKEYREVYPVYIHSGYIWEKAEIFWLKKYLKALKNRKLKPLTILDCPTKDVDKKGWALTGKKIPGYFSRDEEVCLPGRNLLLLSKAALFCFSKEIHEIAIGSLSGNPFPDATPKFFRSFEKTASLAFNFPIRVLTTFLKLKKKELLQRGKDLPLHLSFSCLAPEGIKPCGKCNKCAERDKILKSNFPLP